MNCPYCDETIHPQAKFCAKCGLPLKEDITIHGVSATDDTGASKYVIAAMLTGILVIGGAIAFIGNRPAGQPTEVTIRREPMGGYQKPGTAGIPRATPTVPAFTGQQPGFGARRADPNTASVTRYASTPPVRPQTITPAVPPPAVIAPAPPLMEMARAQSAKSTRVITVRSTTAPIPSLPDSVLDPTMPPSIGDDLAATLPATTERPDLSRYVWDPVHERWALRPDARRRANARNRNRSAGSRVRSTPTGRAGRVPYFFENGAPTSTPPGAVTPSPPPDTE